MVSLRDECQQAIRTLTTAVGNAQQTWHQDIVGFQSYLEYEVEQLLGSVPRGTPPAPTATQPPSEPSSGHGWGSGTMSTAYEGAYSPSQGRSAATHDGSMLSPLDDSGSGSSGSGSGSGDNSPPLADGGSFSVVHDRQLYGFVSGSDPDDDALTFSLSSGPSNGSLSLTSDGSFTYTPKAGYVGDDSFTYTVSDGTQTSAPATVTIAVTDNAPVADGGSFSVVHDRQLYGFVSGSDADDDALTYSVSGGVSHGSLQLGSGGSFTYTPDAGYVGSDSFTYTVSDGILTSAPATVSINVTDNAPVADGGSFSVVHDRQLYGFVSGSDADDDALTFSVVNGVSHGSLQLGSGGSFTYTPDAGYVGSDSFQYKVNDGAEDSKTATVNINVTDNAPVADGGSFSVVHDRQLYGFVSGSDPDDDALTYSVSSGPSNGSLSLSSDGSFTYTPNAGYVGSDSFSYTASDGILTSDPATVTIDVTDNAPVADGGSFSVVHDRQLDGYVSGSDPDGDALTYSLSSGPSNGDLTLNSDGSFNYAPNDGYVGSDSFTYTVNDGALTSDPATVSIDVTDQAPVASGGSFSVVHDHELDGEVSGSDDDDDSLTARLVSGPSNGDLTLNSDGSFNYTPNAGYVGSDSFTYTVSDGALTSDPATVTIDVTDQAPTASGGSFSVVHDRQLDGNVGGSDADGDALTFRVAAQPSNGTLQFNSDGSFLYTPAVGYVGSDSFTYLASDGIQDSEPATVTIAVTDNAPAASGGSFSVLHDEELDGEVSGSDPDGDKLTASVASQPSNGTLAFNSAGSFTYVPNAGYVGSDSFTYTVSDGALSSEPATVSIDVTDQTPVADGGSFSVLHDHELDGEVSGSDADGDPLTFSLSSGPSNGSLQFNNDGSFTYTPDEHYTGSDTFSYTVSDGIRTSDPATVTINVTDQAPVASGGSFSVGHDHQLVGLVSGSDADGDPLSFSAASQPSHGSLILNSDGSFTYTPATHYVGSDSFTYTVSDGVMTSDPATVTITVTDQAPTANGGSDSVLHDQELDGEVSGSDPDGDALSFSAGSGPSNGILNFNSDGSFLYTPNAGYVGSDSFTYTASDGILTSDSATVTIAVTDQAPVADGGSFSVVHDRELDGEVSGSDADNDLLSFSVSSGPSNGNLTLYSDGTFSYLPNVGYIGADSFQYQANDGAENSNTATVTLDVTDQAPTAGNLSYSLPKNKPLTVSAADGLLSAASDPDGDPLTLAVSGGLNHGNLNVNSDGSFTYTPDTDYTGSDSFQYTVSDGVLSSAPATVTLSIHDADTAPVANDDAYSVVHDRELDVSAEGVLANDTDADGDTLTASLASGPSHGSLTFNGDSSFTYTPEAHYIGSDSFTYTASDGQLSSEPATVTINVTDQAPVANDDSYSIQHDQQLDGDVISGVLANDSDPDGDGLTATLVSGPNNGTLVFNSDGSFSYTPNAGWIGSDTFTYTAGDGIRNSAPATATISVLGSVSGKVWLDSDDDGLLDYGEGGLPAINVNLLDGTRNVVASTSTDDNGDYSFLGLSPNTPYSVQFVAPGGYVFAPPNDGPSATSSSADANGNTATFTLTAGQGQTTLNAGLYGSAPIDEQDDIPLLAENETYTGIDFTADGYDPNGEALTPVIVQAPTYGTLVLNPSTGLYDYTAPSGYTGLDSFQFALSDGNTVSDPVTVEVLAYGQTLPLDTYDSFPLVAAGLFDGNGGEPSQADIKQGNINDCWFVAAAAGEAQQNPNQIVSMIKDNGDGTYTVTFTGHKAVATGLVNDTNNYSTANGDWLKVLEKAYGTMARNEAGPPFTKTSYQFINADNTTSRGIEIITGHKTKSQQLSLTSLDKVRAALKTAFADANKKVVTANVAGDSKSAKKAQQNGLVGNHVYTVVDYDASKDQVRLRNPWGKNLVFPYGTDPDFWLGKNDSDNPDPTTLDPGGNGYFWMSVSDFAKNFAWVTEEQ